MTKLGQRVALLTAVGSLSLPALRSDADAALRSLPFLKLGQRFRVLHALTTIGCIRGSPAALAPAQGALSGPADDSGTGRPDESRVWIERQPSEASVADPQNARGRLRESHSPVDAMCTAKAATGTSSSRATGVDGVPGGQHCVLHKELVLQDGARPGAGTLSAHVSRQPTHGDSMMKLGQRLRELPGVGRVGEARTGCSPLFHPPGTQKCGSDSLSEPADEGGALKPSQGLEGLQSQQARARTSESTVGGEDMANEPSLTNGPPTDGPTGPPAELRADCVPAADATPPPRTSLFVVTHTPLVFVRESPDGDARKLGYKWRGERVVVAEVRGPWLRLAHEEGWMLRDGTALGLGELLRPAPSGRPALGAPDDATSMIALPTSAVAEETVSVGELLMRQLFEQRFPKSTPRPEASLPMAGSALEASVCLGIDKVHQGYDRAKLAHRHREWPATGPSGAAGAHAPVAECAAASLTVAHFRERYVLANEPLVIRGALSGWAPLVRWDTAYLRAVAGACRVPVRINPRVAGPTARMFGDPLRMQAYESEERRLDEVLDELERPEPACYAARMPVARLLPELLPDLADGPAERFAACFGPPQAINPVCYLGAGRQATPMHFDPSDNLLCVVEGAKELTLYHPADTEHLYPAGERNTAAVYSLVGSCEPPDLARFPALARARPRTAIVRAGDVLYLPCGWWHAVRGSIGRNLSINYWFELHADKADEAVLMQGIMSKAAREAREHGLHVSGLPAINASPPAVGRRCAQLQLAKR